jgi:hypothetical protein
MPTNWIDLVPTCSNVYVYQADFVCEDCGSKIVERLEKEGTEDTGNSDDFPQGPYPDGGGESDAIQHCGMGEKCVNRVRVPGGVTIGCPLGNSLTSEGVEYLRQTVAKDIVSESAHKRGVGRLWAHIYADALRNYRLASLRLDADPIAQSLIKKLKDLKRKEKAFFAPEILVDCSYIYGKINSPDKTILWRVEATNTGGFGPAETITLPASESHERSLRDMIEEAISEGAWD